MTEGKTATATGSALLGGRLGLIPVSWMDIGLSYAAGRTRVAEDEAGEVEDEPARDYRFYGADFVSRPWKPLEFRGEYARQHAGAAIDSVAPDEADWTAWYLQAAWRIAGTPAEAVVRYGRFDAAVDERSQKQWGLGVNWWLTASTVVKAGYELNDALEDGVDIGDRALLQVAHGF
ncbi:MAG: porin [Nevskiales bacterium]|nr:porin [Nevskiales bacterium]